MPIRKLPLLLINQIAAGEVIERPASVVKELVENSLDAGATRVDVAIEEGGHRLIRISDDGCGIPVEELPLAIAPHATSKLTTAEQLEAVGTFGFRGEALASVSSVSRLRITSRARQQDGTPVDEGAILEAAGDEIRDPAPCAASPGTIVEARDLFFNTPARRKFLRTASTEQGHISDIVGRIAMVHPEVAFTLSHNGRKSLDLPAVDSRAERCIDVIGKEMGEALLEFEHIDTPDHASPNGIVSRVWGLAGMPSIARATGKFQYLCVNGRPIRDRNLQHAVREAYRGLIPPDRFPVVVAFIEMDPVLVDVNVHPAKAEVRFRRPSAAHGMLLATIRQRLLGADLTPQVTWRGSGATPGETGQNGAGPTEEVAPGGSASNALFAASSEQGSDQGAATPVPPMTPREPFAGPFASATPQPGTPGRDSEIDSFVAYFRRMAPQQKGFAFQEVRKALQEAAPDADVGDDAEAEAAAAAAGSSANGRSGGLNILQVHNSYVVTQDADGLLIVDQHALHERVMFEQLSRRILGAEGEPGKLESQRLLMPTIIAADAKRQALLEDLAPLLERIGVEAEPIGPNEVAVHAFPSFLFDRRVEPGDFLRDLLDQADEGKLDVSSPTATEAALHEVLDMMSCKAAVKAGDHLTPEELSDLLKLREEYERSSNCPHGRPTTVRLTLRDLEKQFKRT